MAWGILPGSAHLSLVEEEEEAQGEALLDHPETSVTNVTAPVTLPVTARRQTTTATDVTVLVTLPAIAPLPLATETSLQQGMLLAPMLLLEAQAVLHAITAPRLDTWQEIVRNQTGSVTFATSLAT